MGLMSDDAFLLHQAFLGSGYSGLVQAQNYLQSGLELVVADTDPDVEAGLIQPFSINLTAMEVDVTAGLLRLATEALQRHITDRSGQNFNDYLYVRGLKVTQEFADLSEKLGVPIEPVNVG